MNVLQMSTAEKFRAGGARQAAAGFSLIEVMFAMSVLAVGLLGGIGVICMASANNSGSKLNTTAATLAASAMERIMAIPEKATGPAALTKLTDCTGKTFVMDTSPGGSPLNPGGTFVDYTQAPVTNYSMLYTMCGPGGGVPYDVRWRIDAGPTPATQLVTVSVKTVPAPASPAALFAPKITLHNLRGDF